MCFDSPQVLSIVFQLDNGYIQRTQLGEKAHLDPGCAL
jgi:hypothetical protein